MKLGSLWVGKYVLLSIIILAPIVWVVAPVARPLLREYFKRTSFDAAAWQDETRVYSDDPVRVRMVHDLLRKHNFIGKTQKEAMDLLGQPMPRNEYLFYGAEKLDHRIPPNALAYYLGPETRVFSFDSEWLVLVPDAKNQIADVRIVYGGMQDIRNPDCDRYLVLEIEKVDAQAHRMFIGGQDSLDPEDADAEIKDLSAYVRKCYPDWGNHWSLSFFRDRKLAGYKDEPQLASAVADGSWEKSYVAEYTNETGQLVLTPLLKSRQTISLFSSPADHAP